MGLQAATDVIQAQAEVAVVSALDPRVARSALDGVNGLSPTSLQVCIFGTLA